MIKKCLFPEAAHICALNTCSLISQSGQLPGSHTAQGPGSGCVWSAPVQTVGPDHLTAASPFHSRLREQTWGVHLSSPSQPSVGLSLCIICYLYSENYLRDLCRINWLLCRAVSVCVFEFSHSMSLQKTGWFWESSITPHSTTLSWHVAPCIIKLAMYLAVFCHGHTLVFWSGRK